jgi:hypothetical protein
LNKIFSLTLNKNEAIVFESLSFIDYILLESEEIFWNITEEINILKRIYDLLDANNLPDSIEFNCIKLLNTFLDYNEENLEFRIDVI